jgi:hypothetical protein
MCSWIGAFVLAAGAFGQTYVQITVGNSNQVTPVSISGIGAVLGIYLDPHGGLDGFVRDPDGTITTFGVLGAYPASINDEGAITGSYGSRHGFVRDPEGNFTTFDPQGSIYTVPFSINAGGAVTGYYEESNFVLHGFVREPGGQIIAFDPPGSTATIGYSINAKGTVAGYYQDASNLSHAFVRRPGGEIVSFNALGNAATEASSINDAGTITGFYLFYPRYFGFVRDPQGKFTPFDPGLKTFPTSINDEGAITGVYTDIDDGNEHGFVRSPDGTIDSFIPPFCSSVFGNTSVFGLPSINDEGVITGTCTSLATGYLVGFVRFP